MATIAQNGTKPILASTALPLAETPLQVANTQQALEWVVQ